MYRRPSNNFKIFIANRGLPKPEEIPTYLEIASEILCKDVFLSIFSNFLNYLWSINELSERSDESILLAACIRDSSFVICVDLKSEKYLIRLIDYDGKKKSSVGKYRTERIEMHNIYRSFLNL